MNESVYDSFKIFSTLLILLFIFVSRFQLFFSPSFPEETLMNRVKTFDTITGLPIFSAPNATVKKEELGRP